MAFRLSPCIGIAHRDPMAVAQTYATALGMKSVSGSSEFELAAGVFRFFVDPGKTHPPVLELQTTDLAAARALARANSMEEVVWKGSGNLNLLTDPFGVRWNVFLSQEPFTDDEESDEESPILPKFAIHTTDAGKAAKFYSTLFNLPANKTPRGWTIDHDLIRMVIEEGIPAGPAFFVTGSDILERLGATPQRSVFTDSFGVTWKCQSATDFLTAVTSGDKS